MRGVTQKYIYIDEPTHTKWFKASKNTELKTEEVLITPKFKQWRHVLSKHEHCLSSLWDLVPPSFVVHSYAFHSWQFANQIFSIQHNDNTLILDFHQIEYIFNISKWWLLYQKPLVSRLMILEYLPIPEFKQGWCGTEDCFGSILIQENY